MAKRKTKYEKMLEARVKVKQEARKQMGDHIREIYAKFDEYPQSDKLAIYKETTDDLLKTASTKDEKDAIILMMEDVKKQFAGEELTSNNREYKDSISKLSFYVLAKVEKLETDKSSASAITEAIANS